MKIKPKHCKNSDVSALMQLVNRWDGAKTRQRKTALGKQLSAASDRFYERWHEDGVVLLLRQNAEDMEKIGVVLKCI